MRPSCGRLAWRPQGSWQAAATGAAWGEAAWACRGDDATSGIARQRAEDAAWNSSGGEWTQTTAWIDNDWNSARKPSKGEGKRRGGGARTGTKGRGGSGDRGGQGRGGRYFGSSESCTNLEKPLPEEESHQVDVGWTDCWCDVFQIRFSQEQIHPFFHKRGPIQDVLPQIDNELAEPSKEGVEEDAEDATVFLAPVVKLLPPFPAIRCAKHPLHGEMVSLDNRRLYALQSAAVERWPARCLVRVRALEQLPAEILSVEFHKLAEGGTGPLGSFLGKPRALLEHHCGDVEVLVSSRGSAWEPWHAATAVLKQRCGGTEAITTNTVHTEVADKEAEARVRERAQGEEDADVANAMAMVATLRHSCQSALQEARDAWRVERLAHAAVEDETTIAAHGAAHKSLLAALERLRLAAATAQGVLVRRVGTPGDRDGYISVAAQAAALQRLASASPPS
eukprot:TRINITY_DN61797_c0_g1_i1.p1 TRINITY_DN61797_c0_g1~~TRINITY_DN61797_c0_g1_i1.p1  ORF type:complete len:451 (+),score=82.21 TRINITY_DN61797_c0_g1_i1:60-1412(+)